MCEHPSVQRCIRIGTAAEIREELAEQNPEALAADGFDEALVGIVYRKLLEPIALYDRDACIGVLMRQGMSEEASSTLNEKNSSASWVGEGTPAFLVRPGSWEAPVCAHTPVDRTVE